MKVEELMNDDPVSISPDGTLEEALHKMADKKIRHLVVIEDGDNVAGIISDRDLAMFYDPVHMTQERWKKSYVRDLMSTDPVSIGSQAPVEEAAKLLIKLAISALPVVDNGMLTGILSEKDFVKYFVDNPG